MAKTKAYFQFVEKPRLSSEIARQMEQAIREGRYSPGEALPPERELAQMFNVSRPILREALRILEIQGFISIHQGRGSFVKDPNSDILRVPLRAWLKENLEQVLAYYEARQAIEPVCAALTAERATVRQITALREIIEHAGEGIETHDPASYVASDIDFHSAIARYSGNQYLYLMLKTLIVPETDVRKVVLRLPDHIDTAHHGHQSILEAIETRDPELARQAMIAALNQPMKAIETYLHEGEE
jgi:GntR family transcriptional regulator, transcriptional repressor for pyruvate dehydrogenase complex